MKEEMGKVIYLNNEATSYPKPSCVIEALQAYLNSTPASQFRGSEQIGRPDTEEICRENLGRILGIKETGTIYFSSGATESLNILLCGMADLLEEGEILVTQTEHNSVLRPILNQKCLKKYRMVVVPCTENGKVTLEALEKSVTGRTRAIIVNHCSNVTGRVQDMDMIGEFARRHQLFFLADASQSAGCLPVCVDAWGVDALAFTGHKSLMGIPGTGGYYISPAWKMKPFLYGGTGRNSAQLTYYDGDYEYEVGTQNLPGIAALCAGTGYILETGLQTIMEQEEHLMRILYEGLDAIRGIILYGSRETCKGPVLSFNFRNLSPTDAAYIYQNVYGITVRTGLHCSPLIHRALGTEKQGTVRVSISCFTTEEEIMEFLNATEQMACAGTGEKK